jgi:hypothetical protein
MALSTWGVLDLESDPEIQLCWPNGLANASFRGDELSGCGKYIASAGDVNGDGCEDILISYYYINGEVGKYYLFFGDRTEWHWREDIWLTEPWTFSGVNVVFTAPHGAWAPADGDVPVASAGDVNGDGYDDILIGAPYWNADDEEWPDYYCEGKVYLILGKSCWEDPNIDLDSEADGYIMGEYGTWWGIGSMVASAGDVNNDGYDDILFANDLYYETSSDEQQGRVYLILGDEDLTVGDPNLADDIAATFTGEEHDSDYGYWCAGYSMSAGDVNGDGYSDIIIGDPGYGFHLVPTNPCFCTGRAYLLFGSSDGWSGDTNLADADVIFDAEDLDGPPNPDIGGPSQLGYSVSSGGNVNGDEYDDILIGAPLYTTEYLGGLLWSCNGKAYLVLGRDADDWDELGGAMNVANADASFIGEDAGGWGGRTGCSVANGGDVNDDGYDDMLIGAFVAEKSYLILGRSSNWEQDQSIGTAADATFQGYGGTYSDHSGECVSFAGDFNGNGYDDIFIGAPGVDPMAPTTSSPGYAYLVWGRAIPVAHWMDDPNGLDSSRFGRDGTVNGDPTWLPSGGKLGGALEFDGDGDYVEIEGYKGVTSDLPRTVTAWVRVEPNASTLSIVRWGTSNISGATWSNVINADGKLRVAVWTGTVTGDTAVDDDIWHHVAIVLPDKEGVKVEDILLYVDGVQEDTTLTYGTQTIDTAVDIDVLISEGGSFDGLLDDVRIYDRALSLKEIRQAAGLELNSYWPLDETMGTEPYVGTSPYDYSGNQHDCGIMISKDLSSDGMINGAYEFDGTSDYLHMGGPDQEISGTEPRTVAAWIKTDGDGPIIQWGDSDAGEEWYINVNDGELRLDVGDDEYIEGSTSIDDDAWHHVAVVLPNLPSVDVQDVLLYVDGCLETTTDGGSQSIDTDSGTILISKTSGGSPSYFDGLLDDVRIYNYALSVDDIREVSGFDLQGYWKLDESSGTVASDSGFYGRDGTVSGNPVWDDDGGEICGALEFDGDGDYVEIEGYKGVTGANPRTVAAWVRVEPNASTLSIMRWGTSNISGATWSNVINADGNLRVAVWTGTVTGDTAIDDDIWHHVAIVLPDKEGVKVEDILLYVDGVQEDTTLTYGTQTIDTAVDIDVLISEGGSFDGLLDDVRIYDRALSSVDIRDLAKHACHVCE